MSALTTEAAHALLLQAQELRSCASSYRKAWRSHRQAADQLNVALLKLTEVLQTEARERQWPVRVFALSPSAMNTPMMDQWSLPAEKMMDPVQVAQVIKVAVTLPGSMVLQSAVVTSRVEQYPR